MSARALYLYCTPLTSDSFSSTSFRDVEVRESSALTSRWSTVIEYDGARFYLKFYEGEVKRALEAKINAIVEANVSVAKAFSIYGFSLGRLAHDLVEKGVAPVVLVCRGAVYDGGDEMSVIGFATPYVEGENLLPFLMSRVMGGEEGLEEATARRILCSLLSITAKIHGLGVAHGDLKPANIILRGEKPVIIDFDGAVPAARASPLFCFDPSNGDLAEFSGVKADCSKPFKADWLGILYTGAFLAHASKPVAEARENASDPTVRDPKVKEAFESVLGKSFVADLEAALNGGDPQDPERPVISLLERMRGEGVCA